MRRFLTAVTAVAIGLSLASASAAAVPQCKTGKLCGKACIPKEKQCNIGSVSAKASPAPKAVPKAMAASSTPAAAPKRCKDAKGQKFVKCGTPGSKPV
jgi:hypothetical protein